MSTASTVSPTQIAPPHLPWHDALWERLQTTWREQRWPHALLLHGPIGNGKHALALRIASVLLCDRTREGASLTAAQSWQACGSCAACKLLQSNTHPDFLLLTPDEGKQQISVDQIRDACARLALTSYRSGYKVVIIDPAHQMTAAAANGLLKTLEEPAPNTALILVTARPGALLATLRSRCQQLLVQTPAEHESLAWLTTASGKTFAPHVLRLADGAPLRALDIAANGYENMWQQIGEDLQTLLAGKQDVTHIAKRWADEQLPERLACLEKRVSAWLRATILGTDDPITSFPLPSGGAQLNINRMYTCLDRVRALRAQLARTALQRELAVDAVLVDIFEAWTIHR